MDNHHWPSYNVIGYCRTKGLKVCFAITGGHLPSYPTNERAIDNGFGLIVAY